MGARGLLSLRRQEFRKYRLDWRVRGLLSDDDYERMPGENFRALGNGLSSDRFGGDEQFSGGFRDVEHTPAFDAQHVGE